MVGWSRTYAPDYGDLTLGDGALDEIKSLCILGADLHSKLTFDTHLRDVVSRAAKSLGVVHWAGSYLIVRVCSRTVLMHMFCPTSSIVPLCGCRLRSLIWILDSVVRSSERLREGELVWLEHRRKVSAVCLLYKIYHRTDHPIHEYLHHCVAARNTQTSAALSLLALIIPRCRSDQFRFYSLLSIFGTCCGRVCLVVADWALLIVLFNCVYRGLNFFFVSFCCSLTCLVSCFWSCSGL